MKKLPRTVKTNQDLVRHLMAHSKYGSLAEAFVIAAIRGHAKEIAEAKVFTVESRDFAPIFSPSAWRNVAREITEAMDAFYDEEDHT